MNPTPKENKILKMWGIKRCSGCMKFFTLSKNNFYSHKTPKNRVGRSDYFSSKCRPCFQRAKNPERHAKHTGIIVPHKIEDKIADYGDRGWWIHTRWIGSNSGASSRGVKVKITLDEFYQVFKRYNFSCAYCGISDQDVICVEHVIPICEGGEHTAENIVPSCYNCNAKKGVKRFAEDMKRGNQQLILLEG